MKFEQLLITKEFDYSSSPPYKELVGGFIKTSNPNGEVKINLNDEQCRKILKVVSESVITTAQEAANSLVEVFEQASEKLSLEVPEEIPFKNLLTDFSVVEEEDDIPF